MTNKCEDCGRCCLNTEMPLSLRDIEIILNNFPVKLKKESFALKITNYYYQLKNIDGHCFFFDKTNKNCKIYAFRPQGCKFYPIIYNQDKKKCIYDDYCPRTKLFIQGTREFKMTCNKIKKFLKAELEII
ncbi:MAG: YkgJ family cysteine cluster protein [Promethearchaeota archaeon]